MLENFREIGILIDEIADLSDFLPAVLLVLVRNRKTCYNFLLANFTVIAVIKVATIVMANKGINNMFLYHLMSVVELIFLTLFYADILDFKKQTKLFILIPILSFNIFSSLYLQKVDAWNTYSQTINNLLFMLFGLYFYYDLYKKEETMDVVRSPLFFINTSFLFYFSATFFLFSMGGYFLSEDKIGISFFDNAWTLSSISNIIKNTVLSYALVLLIKSSRQKMVYPN